MLSNLKYKSEDVIEAQGVTFHGELPNSEALKNDFSGSIVELLLPVRADFEISVGSEDFLLLGSVQGKFQLHCSRCLTEVPSGFNQEIEAVFPRATEELDVEEEIRQAVVLAVPSRAVCKLDCKGLCPACGINKNVTECKCEAAPGDSPGQVPNKANPFAKLGELYKKEDK